jgi:HK97 family phage major capsid protein
MTTNLILEAVKTALTEGSATVNLNEASALTGSGTGVGGRVIYDDAFASLRYANPLRMVSRIIQNTGAETAFVVKTGNATVIQTSTTNPWGYGIKNDVGDYAASFWQISSKAINAVVPVRTAVMDDIDGLDASIVSDIALEFAQQEALSMILNNDQASGASTPQTGQTLGLRGLNLYAGSTSAASFGTSGSAPTNGRHTMLQVAASSKTVVAYADLADLVAALPPQYLNQPSTAFMMSPATIKKFRELLTSVGGIPFFTEVGDDDGGAVLYVFGIPVIPNPYMSGYGASTYPVYLACWDRFFTIADNELMSIQRLDQTAPGFISIYAEKRVCSTIRDVFAGVRLVCPA